MTARETTALLSTRDTLTPLIEAEIIEYTGKPYGFRFTKAVFLINSRVWHEFTILDGDNLRLFAYLDDRGTCHSVGEIEEAYTFTF